MVGSDRRLIKIPPRKLPGGARENEKSHAR